MPTTTPTETSNMTNAVAYLRVSTNDQAESGAGLAAQRAAITAYASANNMTITAWYEDAGVSGAAGLEARPGLAAAVAGLRRGSVLLIAKRDRLGRDTLVSLTIEKAVAKRGSVIVSADGLGNGDTAGDVFMRSILDAAAQFERGLIRQRTRAAMAEKRRAGQRVGQVPFGWRVEGDRLVEVEAEQLVLRRITECRDAGMSLRQIAAILTEAAVTTKSGSTTWTHTTIKSILDRAAAVAA